MCTTIALSRRCKVTLLPAPRQSFFAGVCWPTGSEAGGITPPAGSPESGSQHAPACPRQPGRNARSGSTGGAGTPRIAGFGSDGVRVTARPASKAMAVQAAAGTIVSDRPTCATTARSPLRRVAPAPTRAAIVPLRRYARASIPSTRKRRGRHQQGSNNHCPRRLREVELGGASRSRMSRNLGAFNRACNTLVSIASAAASRGTADRY